jgi:hypothetical protein
MAGISPGDPPGHRPPRRRRRRDVIAAAAAVAVVLAVAVAGCGQGSPDTKAPPAPVSAPPSPAPGVAPGAVYVSPTENDVFYTAADRTVWVKNVDNRSLRRVGNGRLVSAPSAIYNGSTVIVFGEGADHKLWWTHRLASGGYAGWALLGGALTAQPGAVFAGGPASPSRYEVFVRGTDGAAYRLVHGATGWASAFTRVGGRLLDGTGPAAAHARVATSNSEATWVSVAGTNRAVYVALLGAFGFSPIGGQTTASPALTAYSDSTGVTLAWFVRGTDNAAWYVVNNRPEWTSIGGRLTSGLAASTDRATGTTYVYALGTDNQVYETTGKLTRSPPWATFSPTWTKVSG